MSAAESGIPVLQGREDVKLISTRALRALAEPWFEMPYLPERQEFLGEDVYFCHKAIVAGFDIWIDHDLSKEVQHVGRYGYSMQDVPGWAP